MTSSHSIRASRAALAALTATLALGQPTVAGAQPAPDNDAARFTIFIRSVRVGSELSSVVRTPEGWTIVGSGQMGPPIDVVSRRIAIHYDADWRPLALDLDASVRGQDQRLRTQVTGTTAASEITVGGAPVQRSDTIDATAILLPNTFFLAYEAVAARLQAAAAGDTLAVYVVPQISMTLTVGQPSQERIQTVVRLIEARRTPFTLAAPGVPTLAGEVWGDESGRLLRVSIPAQSLEVLREDIASVSARQVTVSRPNDEDVRIPANGFLLAGTISRPAVPAAGRLPAIVLVGGSGPTDRDETVAGIPIFGQLAGTLADAGFLVLRYDKRGVGQSGGRIEAATLTDYAEDLRSAVRFLSDRRDVDRRRIAVVGHSEGGSVGMLTAARENRVAALALLATIGVTGAELNMAQVTHALERAGRPEAERQETLDLQKRIQQAVLTGRGWDTIPARLRLQADTPWFQSFLAYDPARIMRDIRQPVLVVQGLLDTQVAPENADRLEVLARARRRDGATVEVVKLPGVNHLLVTAATGEVEEYGTLTERTVHAGVGAAIIQWLRQTWPAN